jgi:hypothetical protein
MALAPSLLPGFRYVIEQGLLLGEVVTIVDNKTFPDSDTERRRKVTVRFEDGTVDYILPRLIGETPVGIENPALVPVVAPTVVPTAPAEEVTTVIANDIPLEVVGSQVRPITDPMDPRLDHLRPSKKKVRKYIRRTMANGMTDVEFLLSFTSDAYRARNEAHPANVMLKGDTQSGKTMLVEVLAVMWAEAMGLPKPMPVFTLSGSSGVTDYDLFGQTTSYTDPETGAESLVWLPGVVDMAAHCGGILYLDEVNAMGERVTSSLHPVADHRHTFVNRNKPVKRNGVFMPETVRTHEDLWIIGTYNEGYSGMGKLNEAFNNRFRTIPWGYDEAVENKLITSPTVRLLGDALRTARATKAHGLRTPVGTAALQNLQQDVETFGPAVAIEVFTGMFVGGEMDVVNAIVRDRSILILLEQEEEQRREEMAQAAPKSDDTLGVMADLDDLVKGWRSAT